MRLTLVILLKSFSDESRAAALEARRAKMKGESEGKPPKAATKFDYVPKDYNDLYNHYFKKQGGVSIVGTLIHGITKGYASDEEHEQWAHDVFTRMMDKKVLENYDPDKSNFGGALYFTTRTIVANALDKKTRDPMKNATSLVNRSDEPEAGTVSAESLDTGHSEEGRREATSALKKLSAHLEKLAANATDVRDKNLIRVVKEIAKGSEPDEIAAALKVTRSTIVNWMGEIHKIATQLRLR